MKKREILDLIKSNRIIKKNELLLSLTRNKNFQNIKLDEELWFPLIPELKEEFNILRKEVVETEKESNECQKIIAKSKCNHEVRLKHFGIFGSHSNCIFCNKTIMSDNCVNWEYSINRNRYCIDFIAKYQDEEDYEYVEEGYTKEQIYLLIEEILKTKNDYEEIDLVQELKKLNLNNSEVKEKPYQKENYILIISGTNKYYVNNDTYLYKKKKSNIAIELLKYFSKLLNTKIELIDSDKHNIDYQNSKIKIEQYDTIEDINKLLNQQQEIPFKIIIDISELYEYSIQNNSVEKKEVELNLEEMFPNSKVIKIKIFSNKKEEEIINYIKKQQLTTYIYQNKNYYYSEETNIRKQNQEDMFSIIKRQLAK